MRFVYSARAALAIETSKGTIATHLETKIDETCKEFLKRVSDWVTKEWESFS